VYQGSGVWTGSIDATQAPAQNVMLIIRAITNADIPYERIINKVDTSKVVSFASKKNNGVLGASIISQSKNAYTVLMNLDKLGSFSIDIYTLAGRKIWNHHGENAPAGTHRIAWNVAGSPLCNGTYLLFLKSNNRRIATRFAVLQ
jgi:hypothetical protein